MLLIIIFHFQITSDPNKICLNEKHCQVLAEFNINRFYIRLNIDRKY